MSGERDLQKNLHIKNLHIKRTEVFVGNFEKNFYMVLYGCGLNVVE